MKRLPAPGAHRAALLLAALLGWPAFGQSAGLTIAPVVVEVDHPRRTVAVTVTNTSRQPVTLQAASLAWGQRDGRDVGTPSDDLLVVPGIARVAPNSSQVFRIALRRPAAMRVERTYRLLLEDISEEQAAALDGSRASGVSIRLTHSIPVMVAPTGPVENAVEHLPCVAPPAPQPPSAGAGAGAAEVCVRLANTGNRRIKIDALTLAGPGWERRVVVSPAVNVLAGAAREWRVPLDAAPGDTLTAVDVHLSQGATLRSQPGGAASITGR